MLVYFVDVLIFRQLISKATTANSDINCDMFACSSVPESSLFDEIRNYNSKF